MFVPFKFAQEAVYGDCVRPLVDSLFRGINATVLAYGQTGLRNCIRLAIVLRMSCAQVEAPIGSDKVSAGHRYSHHVACFSAPLLLHSLSHIDSHESILGSTGKSRHLLTPRMRARADRIRKNTHDGDQRQHHRPDGRCGCAGRRMTPLLPTPTTGHEINAFIHPAAPPGMAAAERLCSYRMCAALPR